jgi:hypothetical protein
MQITRYPFCVTLSSFGMSGGCGSTQHKMLAPDARNKRIWSEGWLTPNSRLCTCGEQARVYLFVVVDDYESFVGYAGMSSCSGSRAKAELDDLERCGAACDAKRVCIRRFVPPWNIIGKPRGAIMSTRLHAHWDV